MMDTKGGEGSPNKVDAKAEEVKEGAAGGEATQDKHNKTPTSSPSKPEDDAETSPHSAKASSTANPGSDPIILEQDPAPQKRDASGSTRPKGPLKPFDFAKQPAKQRPRTNSCAEIGDSNGTSDREPWSFMTTWKEREEQNRIQLEKLSADDFFVKNLENVCHDNREYLKEKKKTEATAGKKKKKPVDPSTYKFAVENDAHMVESLMNLHMDKHPPQGSSVKSPHIKLEPSFIGQLKSETEAILGRPLFPDEDVLAVTLTVLRQALGNTYNTAHELTNGILAIDGRRQTRKSGFEMYTGRDEMVQQAEANFENLMKMEELLVQVQMHMTAAHRAKMSPFLTLEEPSREPSRCNSPVASRTHTIHSTKLPSRRQSRQGTPLGTPKQSNGSKNSGIPEAINKLSQDMQATDPNRVVNTGAPLLSLAPVITSSNNHSNNMTTNRPSATMTHKTNGQGKAIPQNDTR